MALKKLYDFNGLPISNAYIRVGHISGGKSGWSAQVLVFANKAAADEGKNPVTAFAQNGVEYVEGEPAHVTIYNAIKAREDMAGAEDC